LYRCTTVLYPFSKIAKSGYFTISQCDGLSPDRKMSRQNKKARKHCNSHHSNNTTALLEHLKSQGASFPKLSFQNTPSSGISAIATEDIEIGEIVFSLPAISILTTTKVRQSPLGQSLLRTSNSNNSSILSNEFLLCLYLILARKCPENPFHSYAAALSLMPPDTTNWPIEIQARVRGTVAKATNTALQELKQWHTFCTTVEHLQLPPPFDVEKPTMEELLWARGHVVSRRFPENVTSLSSKVSKDSNLLIGYSMLPGLDLLNHSHDVKMEWDVDAHGTVRFKTMTAVLKGFECLNNYGTKSNTQLLFMHGFALPNNPHDAVALSLKTKDATGQTKMLWQGSFYGNETSLPYAMLSHFLDDDDDDDDDDNKGIISNDVISYCLEWIQSYLTPLEKHEDKETKLLNSKSNNNRVDIRLQWIAEHHVSQRRILKHIQHLLRTKSIGSS
jgi:hypothetical protein